MSKGVLRNFMKFTLFSCEFCEISKNTTFFTEHLWTTASKIVLGKIYAKQWQECRSTGQKQLFADVLQNRFFSENSQMLQESMFETYKNF